jgi:hypothetical protein
LQEEIDEKALFSSIFGGLKIEFFEILKNPWMI